MPARCGPAMAQSDHPLTPDQIRGAIVALVKLAAERERALERGWPIAEDVRVHDEQALATVVRAMEEHTMALPLARSGPSIVQAEDVMLAELRDQLTPILTDLRKDKISSAEAEAALRDALNKVMPDVSTDDLRRAAAAVHGNVGRLAIDRAFLARHGKRTTRETAGELVARLLNRRGARSIEHGAKLLRDHGVAESGNAEMVLGLRGTIAGKFALVAYVLRALGYTEDRVNAVREVLLPPRKDDSALSRASVLRTRSREPEGSGSVG